MNNSVDISSDLSKSSNSMSFDLLDVLEQETQAILREIGDVEYRKRYSDVPAACHKMLFGDVKPCKSFRHVSSLLTKGC